MRFPEVLKALAFADDLINSRYGTTPSKVMAFGAKFYNPLGPLKSC